MQVIDLISCHQNIELCQRNITFLFHSEVTILALLEVALRMKDMILKQKTKITQVATYKI